MRFLAAIAAAIGLASPASAIVYSFESNAIADGGLFDLSGSVDFDPEQYIFEETAGLTIDSYTNAGGYALPDVTYWYNPQLRLLTVGKETFATGIGGDGDDDFIARFRRVGGDMLPQEQLAFNADGEIVRYDFPDKLPFEQFPGEGQPDDLFEPGGPLGPPATIPLPAGAWLLLAGLGGLGLIRRKTA